MKETVLEDKMYLICYETWRKWKQDGHIYMEKESTNTFFHPGATIQEAVKGFKDIFENSDSQAFKILAITDITGCDLKDFVL